MGYTTTFDGLFELDETLTAEHKAYLEAFSDTRRIKRAAAKVALLPDPVREAVGLPVGEDGAYFVGGSNAYDTTDAYSAVDYNSPPKGQPGIRCQWVPSPGGNSIEWDGGEKFYHYTDWLDYIIDHFLKPWGYVLNGEAHWYGEDHGDFGVIIVNDNKVTVKYGRIVYE